MITQISAKITNEGNNYDQECVASIWLLTQLLYQFRSTDS